ncbi:MAG: transcriptional regulator, family [Eubacterium sp.]|nr:transcriptional regulator, family [Eubacterium sp.]
MSVFAERIKDLRDKRGHTQEEVGRAVGKSREAVSKYEIGEREPDLTAVATLAKYFDVSADYILGITDDTGVLTGNKQRPYGLGPSILEKYLADDDFEPHLKLAVKIKENNIELSKVEKFVNDLIKQQKKQKHP